jgi:hypothetical protein
MELVGYGVILSLIVGFLAVLIPCLRIVRKAGFHPAWAWTVCLILGSGWWGQIALTWWSSGMADRRTFAATLAPYLGAIFPIVALLALWCFAFVGWPALRGAQLPAPGGSTPGSKS